MKVFVTQRIPRAGLDMRCQAYPGFVINSEDRVLQHSKLLEKVRGASGLLTLLADRIDAAVLDAAGPQLMIIANMAVGFDNIDLAAAAARGIMVSNTPGILTDATADKGMWNLFTDKHEEPVRKWVRIAGRSMICSAIQIPDTNTDGRVADFFFFV